MLRSLSSGSMTDEAGLVVAEMALDQRQSAFADRAEADHDDGPVDAGMHWPFAHSQPLPNLVHIGHSAQTEVAPGKTPRRPREIGALIQAAFAAITDVGSLVRPVAAIIPAGAIERAGNEFERQQAPPLEGSGQPQACGLVSAKAEAAVIGRDRPRGRWRRGPPCAPRARPCAPAPRQCRCDGGRRQPLSGRAAKPIVRWRRQHSTGGPCR